MDTQPAASSSWKGLSRCRLTSAAKILGSRAAAICAVMASRWATIMASLRCDARLGDLAGDARVGGIKLSDGDVRGKLRTCTQNSGHSRCGRDWEITSRCAFSHSVC
jgi:hypothetical protein